MGLYKWQNIKRRIGHVKNPVGIEVGVFRGDLSKRLLANIPGLTLYMVDLWSAATYEGKGDESASPEMRNEYEHNCENNYNITINNTREFGRRAVIRRQDSGTAASTFQDGFFDFVFLDADHSYEGVKADIIAWSPKVKKGGWLCGHDYGNFPGVNRAVDELFPSAEIDTDYTWFVKL